MSKNFGASIRTTRIKTCCLFLWSFKYFAKHFRTTSLVKFHIHTLVANSIEQTKSPKPISISCIFRQIKTYSHVTLSTKIIYFIRAYLIQNTTNIATISQVSIMQKQFDTLLMSITIQMIYSFGIETTRTTNNTVNFITFF